MIGPERSSGSNAVYSESIRAGKAVRILVSSIYLTLLVMCTAIAVLDSQFISMSIIIITAVTLAFALLYLNFSTLRIDITHSHLKVRYGRLHCKIFPLEQITDCEHIQIRFREYGGIGIRLGRDGTWAYHTFLGDAVKVAVVNERPFAFSTTHPEEVCELLRELRS